MTDTIPMPTFSPERLAKITTLYSGSHEVADSDQEFRACVMEAVAYVAGEPWSDAPECACPVITAFMVSWNDGLPDDERSALLLPLIPKLVGTRSTPEIEERRSLMAADWLVRVHTPAWLRLAGMTAQADALAHLPEITSMEQVPSIRGPIEAARRDAAAARAAAWDAARAAAWAAARDAAWDAARAAARDAAWDAAGDAAWAAARAAARDAAWDAAGDAAWDAAWDALSTTKRELQQSAVQLVERMCALKAA
jgi:hypothetical protein